MGQRIRPTLYAPCLQSHRPASHHNFRGHRVYKDEYLARSGRKAVLSGPLRHKICHDGKRGTGQTKELLFIR